MEHNDPFGFVGLTYDDVLLLPGHTDVIPSEADTSSRVTRRITVATPLLSAAMDLRRSELALASLRGYSRRQMWFLGLVEPVLMLVIATPIGVVTGYGAARALGAAWLVLGSLTEVAERVRLGSAPFGESLRRANAVRAAFPAPDGADEQALREEFNAMIAVA